MVPLSCRHHAPEQTAKTKKLQSFTSSRKQNDLTLPQTAKMTRVKGEGYCGHRLTTWETVTDNSHEVPVHYKWTCTQCGFLKNTMEMFQCGSCKYGHGNRSFANGSDSSIQWEVTECDYEGNEHWEQRGRKRRSE